MDEEVALVSRMVLTGEVERVAARGIEAHHFVDEGARAVFEIASEHVSTWRKPPSLEAVRRELDRRRVDFKLRVVEDDVGYLAHEFVKTVSHRNAIEKWRDLQEAIDDPAQRHRLAEVFAEHARDMATLVPTPRVSRLSDMADRIIAIRKEQDGGIRPGINTGFRHADGFIKGVRRTEYATFLGYMGKGKTTAMIWAVHEAYLQNVPPPMFVSLEMESEELYDKWDAMCAGISAMALRARELAPDDYEKLERAAQKVKDSSSDIIVIDDVQGAATVDRIANLADKYKPGLIAVDYVSLMEAHRDIAADWERVQHISRQLKRLARALRIPVYAAAQSNRHAESEGPTLDNIAYATAIGQDSNVVFGVHETEEWAAVKKVEVRLLKNRGGPKGNSFEFWDRDRMIHRPFRPQDEWAGRMNAA